jgi:hypothetical protein
MVKPGRAMVRHRNGRTLRCEEPAQTGNETHLTYVRREVGRRKEERRNNSIERTGRNVANLQMWRGSV